MPKYQIFPELIALAEWGLQNEAQGEKKAFAPPAGDPAAAGGAPMDPAAAGGGAPPMDPMAAAGGAPPMDPMAAGGAVPPGGAGAVPPELQAMVDQAVAASQAGAGAAGAAAGGAGAGPGGAGSKKVDPGFMYMELSRIRKMVDQVMKHNNIPMPPDILDDATTAEAVMGAGPQSQPLGAEGAAGAPPAGPEGGAELPAIGGNAAVTPIEPAKTAAELVRSDINVGQPVTSSALQRQGQSLDALAALSRSLNNRDAR